MTTAKFTLIFFLVLILIGAGILDFTNIRVLPISMMIIGLIGFIANGLIIIEED